MDSSSSTSSNKSNNSNRLPMPAKYQRRKQVYEKLRARVRGEALPAVPEEFQDEQDGSMATDSTYFFHDDGRKMRMIVQIIGVMFTLLMGAAGIRQTFVSAQRFMTLSSSFSTKGGADGNETPTRRHWDGGWPSDEGEGADDDHYDEEDDNNVVLSETLRFMVDIREPLHATDRALFWVVPRAGSTTVKHIVSRCLGLLSATESGGGAEPANYLTTVTDLEGGEYLNVDTSTIEGIEHAAKLEGGNLPNLQLVATSFLHEAADMLFSDYYRGRVFSMLRHPIERAGSLFYAMSDDPNNKSVAGMTLEDYANSDVAERNWMTRFLSNKAQTPEKELTEQDVAVAKQVLRKKVLVGLLQYKGESMRRFEEYFGWSALIDRDQRTSECHTRLLEWAWPNKHKHPAVREGSEAWRILAERNDLDMEVYRFAEHLFEQQGQRLFSRPTTTTQFGLRRLVRRAR